jgi:uncharacterized protein (TIGR00369 family)
MTGDEAAAQGWKPLRENGGFESLIGPLWFRREGDGAAFAFRAEARHANPNGVVHGGMLFSLADHALGSAVFFAGGKRPCATVSLNCDFVAAARPGDWIECRAEILRQGRSLVFVRGRVFAGERLLATADGVWKILGAE